jgi:phosphatidylserine/phosphatidylglycerophosphate/cardiolipin synthase-like enzyme
MGTRRVVGRIDHVFGEGIERLVLKHHRRRLLRIGWERAFATSPSLWADGDPPPRRGCSLEILIDGAEAFPAILEALEQARSHVHFAGWHVTPGFEMDKEPPVAVREILAALAERVKVRVLLWGGAPLPPPFEPNRRDMKRLADSLRSAAPVELALDSRERPLHCHHEKLIVIDDEIAFVGGIDLTTLAGDRYDSPDHPLRRGVGWHDVATRLTGPVVGDVVEHFAMRWREVTGRALDPAGPPVTTGDVEVQLVRTVPEKVYDSVPKGDFRILQTYLNALASARRLIYLENQFLWSPEIVEILKRKLIEPPSDDFRLAVVLPARPAMGEDDTKGQLGVLVEADGGRGRLLACSVYSREGSAALPVYIHAKVGIVDDRWMSIGSANLNEHSLFNDTEVNVVVCNEDVVARTRQRLWAEHLEMGLDEATGDPLELIESRWKPISQEQLERRGKGLALTHRLVRLEGVSSRSKRIIGPIQSLLVDG